MNSITSLEVQISTVTISITLVYEVRMFKEGETEVPGTGYDYILLFHYETPNANYVLLTSLPTSILESVRV